MHIYLEIKQKTKNLSELKWFRNIVVKLKIIKAGIKPELYRNWKGFHRMSHIQVTSEFIRCRSFALTAELPGDLVIASLADVLILSVPYTISFTNAFSEPWFWQINLLQNGFKLYKMRVHLLGLLYPASNAYL